MSPSSASARIGSMPKADAGERVIATNRKAFFNYEILDRVEAGIGLLGTEVKSIREGGLNFRDSFVEFRGGELFLVGCRIGPYSHGNLQNHSEGRDRKLLLHKKEIQRFGGRATEKGLTIVPLRAYLKRGRVKVEIGLARGKKAHDKRETIKRRDLERETRQAVRDHRS
jgi:SsrA-binding protein